MPRYVLLRHDHPALHWDLMLEAGPALWTWRLSHPLRPGESQSAERIADHRLVYLDYEGPVSGGRGEVRREAAGSFEWIEKGEGRAVVRLDGGAVLTLADGSAHLDPDRGSADSP